MYILLTVLHVIVALTLILIVLLQTGKGASIGAVFGGAGQTLFGPRGAGTFLSKMTAGAAILFMVTSMALTILAGRRDTASVVTETAPKAQKQSKPPVSPPATQERKPSSPAVPSPQEPAEAR